MSAVPKVTRALLNAPLPSIIERLGISIAQAQAALDQTLSNWRKRWQQPKSI
ncbi:MAG: hypothetical protein LRY63_02105 [Nitrincola sp.]|nr:hypothetical protein [Nitrincola sp.]